MVDYRPVPDDRREEVSRMLSYAFSPEDGPFEPDDDDEVPPQARLGDDRGLFEDDDLISVCRHHYFDARVRDTTVTMAGLSAVATPPERRRQGLVRRLLAESLAEYREREAVISTLWPFSTPFYAQFGWATAFRGATQRAEPSTFRIGEANDDSEERFYRATPDDWPALDVVLNAHAHEYELAVDRTESWWRNRAFHGWNSDPFVYVMERNDEPRGYVVYSIADDGDERELRVRDLAFVDPAAHRALLGFLADHDSQVATVRITGPAGEDVLDQVADPSALSVSIEAGAMVRIVDVVGVLEAISYPESLSGEVRFAVDDQLADWNDGTFTLSVESGTATVEHTAQPPAVELGIGALSQLFVGYRSLSDLEASNDAVVSDPTARDIVDVAFPESSVYLREGF